MHRITVPKINFDKNTVVALFFGTKTRGGYAYEIIDISTIATDLVIKVKEKKTRNGNNYNHATKSFCSYTKNCRKNC